MVVWIFAAGCSGYSARPGASDGGATADAPLPALDAPGPISDAVLPGAACPSRPVEIARIPGAFLQPVDNTAFFEFTFKQGAYTRDADGDGKADLLVVEHVDVAVEIGRSPSANRAAVDHAANAARVAV